MLIARLFGMPVRAVAVGVRTGFIEIACSHWPRADELLVYYVAGEAAWLLWRRGPGRCCTWRVESGGDVDLIRRTWPYIRRAGAAEPRLLRRVWRRAGALLRLHRGRLAAVAGELAGPDSPMRLAGPWGIAGRCGEAAASGPTGRAFLQALHTIAGGGCRNLQEGGRP